MDLDGRIVLITGASQGIGAACAAAFRARGARLLLTARSPEKLVAVAGPRDLVVPADLTLPDSPARVVQACIDVFGRVDVLVNNAGAGLYTPAHETDLRTARHLFDLDFFAPLQMVRHVVPPMRSRGSGCIVNVDSVAGLVALPWFPLYSAAKSALHSLSDSLRTELRDTGIHCMSVSPGYVRTGFQQNILGGTVPSVLGTMRQKWAITADECAAAIVRGVERNARSVVVPRSAHALIWLSRLFPSLTARRLDAIRSKH